MSALFEQIVERLRPLDVSRILVFGSTVEGKRNERDSDIDLAIVVDSPSSFESYDKRLEMKSRLRAALLEINAEVAIDILLYTEDEFRRFSGESGFVATEVIGKGQTLYAKAG